jgi:hypothetical protein
MANELFNSLSRACRAGGHVVYREGANGEAGRFERAGKRHAIATFFGSASAKELNQKTLDKIKEVLNAERTADSVGVLSGDTFDATYFSDARSLKIENSGGKRVESAAIKRIIADIRNDIVSNPAIIEASKDKLIDDYLDDEMNYSFMEYCVGADGSAKDMAGMMAKILLNDAVRRSPIETHEQLETFRREMPQLLIRNINSFGVYLRHIESDAKDFGALFERFRNFDAENGGQTNCLERFVLTLCKVVQFKDGESKCDEVAASRFLSALGTEKGQNLITQHGFTPDEMIDAYKIVNGCNIKAEGENSSDTSMNRYVAALELKLSHGEAFGNFEPPKGVSISGLDYSKNVLTGLASVLPDVRADHIDGFISVMADILKCNAEIGASAESVEAGARAGCGTLQFLREQEGTHPGALKDGLQLMKDLHAPVDAETMKGLLALTEKTVNGLLHAESFFESLDRNLASVCFAGNGIKSLLGKEEKNWIVAKFILASVPKVHYEEGVERSGRMISAQRVCGDMLLSSFGRNLQAFYARVGGPLCTKYAKALEFLTDRYWTEGVCGKFSFEEVDAFQVSTALKEKYEIDSRTAVKPENYKTSPRDYNEFAGIQSDANAAEAFVDGVLKNARILDGDKVRVKQLALQHIAFVCKTSGGVVAREGVVNITSRYCRMARWGGALLDRLEKEVPVSHRRAVILSLEAYNCSSDAKLFDMLTKDRGTLNNVKAYIDECSEKERMGHALEGTCVQAYHIHTIIAGEVGSQVDLDPMRNPHLATIYSRMKEG